MQYLKVFYKPELLSQSCDDHKHTHFTDGDTKHKDIRYYAVLKQHVADL